MTAAATTALRPTWPAATRDHFLDASAVLRCALIALVVGSILTAVNLTATLADGRMSVGIALAIVVNYLMPFLVSSAGGIATRRAARAGAR